jgi:hypothetical protein
MNRLYRVAADLTPRLVGEYSTPGFACLEAWTRYKNGPDRIDEVAYFLVCDNKILYYCEPCENGATWEEGTES